MAAPPSTVSIQKSPPATIHHVSTYPGSLQNSSVNSSRETTPTPQTGSVGASRENTPPCRSVSYPPPGPDTPTTKGPSVRSASWTSEIPIMPPLSVNVNVGPEMGTSNIAGMMGAMSVSSVLSNPLTNHAMSLVYQSLDHQYQPIAPCPTSKESMEIFEKHCKLAEQYLRYQTEIAMFEQTRHELLKEFREDVIDQHSTLQLQQEFSQLAKENESLKIFHKNLTEQVERIRKRNQQNKRVST